MFLFLIGPLWNEFHINHISKYEKSSILLTIFMNHLRDVLAGLIVFCFYWCPPSARSEDWLNSNKPASWSVGQEFDSRSDHFRDFRLVWFKDLTVNFYRIFSCWDYDERTPSYHLGILRVLFRNTENIQIVLGNSWGEPVSRRKHPTAAHFLFFINNRR